MWRSESTKNELLRLFQTSSELIVFDVETTGFSSDKNHVIQFSGLKLSISDGNLNEIERFDTYINPGYSLPEKITEVTGITDSILVDAPSERDIFPKIHSFLGDTPNVCGHNVSFDIRFAKAMYSRYGLNFEPQATLDTLEMARDIAASIKELPNNKLGTLATHFGVDYGLTFHNSMDDVIACSRLLRVFLKEYKEREDEREATTMMGMACEKTKAKVQSLRFWPGYRGHSRIYIYTDCGDFYYDIFKKIWGKGNNCFYEIDMIDMEQLRVDSLKFANAATEREFAKFRG